MKILILGSGLLGVSSAYELARRGFDVTVIDRQAECATECSYANGGQLSYSHAEPWANPYVLPKLAKWIFREDAPLVFHPRADWQMIKWGLKFLRNCTPARAQVNALTLLRLGMYSKQKLNAIRAEHDIAFDFSPCGILNIFGTDKELDEAKRQSEFQAKFGCQERFLARDECFSLEPALLHTSRAIVGGIHSFNDECGDAYLYCNALTRIATERYGVKFLYGVSVENIIAENGTVKAIIANNGEMSADGYVMALGAYSSIHLRRLGVHVPVYPMKGYSLTLDANEYCPNVSVNDGSSKIVCTPLGKRMRVAGTAEFAGYNTSINEKRIVPILNTAKGLFPKADWEQDIQKWACLRPSTPDGPPIIGPTPFRNLFINIGHGTLGWTQAAGSAFILSDIMEGKIPEILMQGLTIERY